MPNDTGLHLRIESSEGDLAEIIKDATYSEYVVGRRLKTVKPRPDHIFIGDKYASRKHFRLFFDEEAAGWMVEDMGSSNGTRLNGSFIVSPQPIQTGSTVRVGTTDIHIEILSPEQLSKLGHRVGADSEGPLSPAVDEGKSEDATVMFGAVKSGVSISKRGTIVGLSKDGDEEGGPVTSLMPSVGRGNDATFTSAAMGDPTFTSHAMTGGANGANTFVAQGDPTFVGGGGGDHTHAGATRTELKAPDFDEEAAAIALANIQRMGDVDASATLADSATQMDMPSVSAATWASPMINNLIRGNLLERARVPTIYEKARISGQTFFRMMVEDDSVQFVLDDVYRFVSKEYGFSIIEDEKALAEIALETDWLPFKLAANLGIVLVQSENSDEVRYAAIDPFDLGAEDWVRRCSGKKKLSKVLVTRTVFLEVMERKKAQTSEEGEEIGMAINITTHQERTLREHLDHVEVPQMVNFFLHRAYTQGASDIHIEPTEEFLMVRNRVHGVLREDTTLPIAIHPEVSSRLKIMSTMDVAEKRRPQDGRISVLIQDNPIDIRVSTYPTVYGEKIVLRLLDKNALRPSIETLGLLARDQRLLKDKLNAPYGLIMISGPTGSGKTTTLYSCLGSIDKTSKNVLTVEDPVEYRLKGVHQMQVNEKIGLTFAAGLRTILRQDPDVIMVGECRDEDTASMAIKASLTGHIVFSTIHTNDAVDVVTRLMDMNIEPFLVSNSLSIAIAQRLVRTICPNCRTAIPGSKVLEELQREGASNERLRNLNIEIDPDITYAKGMGCNNCHQTGYAGRQAVFEVFEMTEAARAIILDPDFNALKLRHYAKGSGMTTLVSHGLKLVEEEITTFNEVIRVLGE